MKSRELGEIGENYVCNLLIRDGYKILSRNFRGKYFEIDIIAIKKAKLYFVEVKARQGLQLYEQHKSITKFKIHKINRGINKYLAENPSYSDHETTIKTAFVLINPVTGTLKVVFYDYFD